jgi:hypothetical protein
VTNHVSRRAGGGLHGRLIRICEWPKEKTAPAAGRPGPLARALGLGGAMEEEAGNPA